MTINMDPTSTYAMKLDSQETKEWGGVSPTPQRSLRYQEMKDKMYKHLWKDNASAAFIARRMYVCMCKVFMSACVIAIRSEQPYIQIYSTVEKPQRKISCFPCARH